MIDLVPSILAVVAIFIKKRTSDVIAVWLFSFFYIVSLITHYLFRGESIVFDINIVISLAFTASLLLIGRMTILIWVLIVTELLLVVTNVFSIWTYNEQIEWLYEFRGELELSIIAMQWLALLGIGNGSNTRVHALYSDIIRYIQTH